MKTYVYLSLAISLVTLVLSHLVSFFVHGNPFANLTSPEILLYGAVDGRTLFANKEIWRLFSAQLLHQKPGHMIFNVGMCWYLGWLIEKRIGSTRFALIYWIGGAIGTFTSVFFLPDLVSSGASQALMALCAALLIMHWREYQIPKTGFIAVMITVIFQIGLDLHFSHSLKPGHTFGFIAGLFLTVLLVRSKKSIQVV